MPSTTTETDASSRLRTVRETLGLSQREFAKELGVAPSALAQWETSRRTLPGPIVRLLALYEEQLRIAPPKPARADAPKRRSQFGWLSRTASSMYAGALWGLLRTIEERSPATSFERSVRSAALDHYVRTLGELKGLGLKFGQWLANADAIDPVQVERGTSLSVLDLQATPMSATEVLELFLGELGKTPREVFAEWNPKPVFAASIGQVHRARLRSGEEVAVKLQYPHIEQTMQDDLRSVELLDRLYCVLAPAQEPKTMFDELSARFMEECDYELEADNMRRFDAMFDARTDIRIPKVRAALSTRRILTVDWVEGSSLEAFARTASQEERDRAGAAIWDFFYGGAYEGTFHSDPHAGNLLIQDDAVTFLDFGRVAGGKNGDPKMVGLWKALARAVLEKDRSRTMDLIVQMNLTRSLDVAGDDLHRFTVATHMPWLCEGPFTFTADFAHLCWRLIRHDNVRKHMNVPRSTVMWHQLVFGVYALLVPLRCRIDCRTKTLEALYAPGERRPDPYTQEELASLGLAL